MSFCLQCGRRLPFLGQLLGAKRFCSAAHQKLYEEHSARLALEALLQPAVSPLAVRDRRPAAARQYSTEPPLQPFLGLDAMGAANLPLTPLMIEGFLDPPARPRLPVTPHSRQCFHRADLRVQPLSRLPHASPVPASYGVLRNPEEMTKPLPRLRVAWRRAPAPLSPAGANDWGDATLLRLSWQRFPAAPAPCANSLPDDAAPAPAGCAIARRLTPSAVPSCAPPTLPLARLLRVEPPAAAAAMPLPLPAATSASWVEPEGVVARSAILTGFAAQRAELPLAGDLFELESDVRAASSQAAAQSLPAEPVDPAGPPAKGRMETEHTWRPPRLPLAGDLFELESDVRAASSQAAAQSLPAEPVDPAWPPAKGSLEMEHTWRPPRLPLSPDLFLLWDGVPAADSTSCAAEIAPVWEFGWLGSQRLAMPRAALHVAPPAPPLVRMPPWEAPWRSSVCIVGDELAIIPLWDAGGAAARLPASYSAEALARLRSGDAARFRVSAGSGRPAAALFSAPPRRKVAPRPIPAGLEAIHIPQPLAAPLRPCMAFGAAPEGARLPDLAEGAPRGVVIPISRAGAAAIQPLTAAASRKRG